MENNLDLYIKKIQPLNSTIIEINNLCQNPDTSIVDLSELIKKDPVLTGKILKIVNSPLYNFKNEINTINRAIALFGMSTIKGFVLNTVLNESGFNSLSAYNLSEEDFLYLCNLQTNEAIKLSRKKHYSIEEENILSTIVFLFELGKLVTNQIINDYEKEKEFKEEILLCDNIEEIYNLEQKFINVNSIKATIEILKKWNIDENILDILNSLNNNKNIENLQNNKLKNELLYIINKYSIINMIKEKNVNRS